MNIRKMTSRGGEKIELQMTPMIDIVFQLLIFFILTLKIVAPEGDFAISMPSGTGRTPLDFPLPIRIQLSADEEGELASIVRLDPAGSGESYPDMAALKQFIKKRVDQHGGPGSNGVKELEVELDIDYGLKHTYAIAAISTISGEKKGDHVEKWIEKIQFTPPPRN
jgi:biopolymer transport protein ExbD